MIYHLGDHGVDGCDLKAGYIWCHGEYPQERIPLWRKDERTSTTVPMTEACLEMLFRVCLPNITGSEVRWSRHHPINYKGN